MADHEDRIDNHRVDDDRVAGGCGQGLSASQVPATLVDGAPTDGDIATIDGDIAAIDGDLPGGGDRRDGDDPASENLR